MNDEEAHSVTIAEAKCAEIGARIERAKEDAAGNRSKAREMAFAALDDPAAKRLSEKLAGDAQRLEDDIEHRLTPALDEAKRRVAVATAAAAEEDKRRRAELAGPIAERLIARGGDIDDAMQRARENWRSLLADTAALIKLGAPIRSPLGFELMNALDVALGEFHPNPRAVAPGARTTFEALAAARARHVAAWAARQLGKDAPDAQGEPPAAVASSAALSAASAAEAGQEPSMARSEAIEEEAA